MIIERGILKIFSDNLDVNSDTGIIKTIIEALSHVLSHGKSNQPGAPNAFQAQCEVTGIVDKLEQLQLHPSRTVYEVTIALIETYFDVHDPI